MAFLHPHDAGAHIAAGGGVSGTDVTVTFGADTDQLR